MKPIRVWLAWSVLAVVVTAGWGGFAHQHDAASAPADCVRCQVVHQTPALTPPAAFTAPGFTAQAVPAPLAISPELPMSGPAHGLSPPSAS